MLTQRNVLVYFLAVAAGAFFCPSAIAGLDLENQTEISIDNLDLDHDGKISRPEVGEYMFYYFDRDGNETLTKGEYHADRDIAIVPQENPAITFIDIDNDGNDDGINYDIDSFLHAAMVGEPEPGVSKIKAYDFVDIYFLKLDTDESRGIELGEWQKTYAQHGTNKPKQAPEAANQDHYN